MKVAIFVQSDRKSTYEAVLEQLQELNIGINDITWVFIDSPKNRDIIPSCKRANEHFTEIKEVKELQKIIEHIELLDVTGLSKDNLIRIFSVVAGKRSIRIYTLSKDHQTNQTNYKDLTADSNVDSFRANFLRYRNIIKALTSITLIGFASLIILWLLNFNSSSPFVTWLGIFLGIFGITITYLKV